MKKGWISLVMASSMMLALTACSGAASTPTAAATEAKTEEKKEESKAEATDAGNGFRNLQYGCLRLCKKHKQIKNSVW